MAQYGSVDAVASAWNTTLRTVDDISARFPDTAASFAGGDGQIADDWRRSLDTRVASLWVRLREAVPEPIHLIATAGSGGQAGLDGAFAYASTPAHLRERPSSDLNAWAVAWNRTEDMIIESFGNSGWMTAFHAADDRAFRGAPLGIMIPAYAPEFGGGSLPAAFARAADAKVRGVLVASWNNHFDGTSDEPTREYGHEAYAQLVRAVATYRLAIDAVPPS